MPLTRDFAFVVEDGKAAGDLVRAVAGADKALIADVRVFDVYRGAGVPDGVEERRARLVGFVYSPLRAEDLLSRIYGGDPEEREISLAVYDGPVPAAETLMFQTDADHARYDGPLRAALTLDHAGNRWTAVVAARAISTFQQKFQPLMR